MCEEAQHTVAGNIQLQDLAGYLSNKVIAGSVNQQFGWDSTQTTSTLFDGVRRWQPDQLTADPGTFDYTAPVDCNCINAIVHKQFTYCFSLNVHRHNNRMFAVKPFQPTYLVDQTLLDLCLLPD